MLSILVAGQPNLDPLQTVRDYVARHEATIRKFDLVAGSSPDALTPLLVKASRALSSRITKAEERWLLGVEAAAP